MTLHVRAEQKNERKGRLVLLFVTRRVRTTMNGRKKEMLAD